MENQAKNIYRILPSKLRSSVLNSVTPLGHFFSRLRVNPNLITFFALLMGIASGVLFATEHPLWATLAIILCGLLDILDGKVATQSNRRSLFGAIFDSTLDRYSEFAIYLGLAIHFRHHWALWIIFFTFLGSTMVSYTRARSEGLDIECQVGFMQRAERLVILTLASLIGVIFHLFDLIMVIALIIIALFSNITAWQRLLFVYQVEKQKKENPRS
ncbi:MAG TPA: CDP-alcohol phosphatidyltransferase family protein [Candidatus Aminicenantes bacterium]|nr:CDP-alcohol phosphatidyltransferase family protein [Candidatus Aminicenantes bacterium]